MPAVWFPAVRTGTGTDVFTERLAAGLERRGIRAEITWLPLRAEYAPRTVAIPQPPAWATVCHINTWLHPRFIPARLPVVATLHHAIHDPALRPYKGWLRAAYHRHWITPIERRVLRRADRVVAVSNFVAEMARQTLCDMPMQVVYNGIDTELFRPDGREHQPGAPFRLLYVGAWRGLKGVDLLAPIMRELGAGFELHYTGGSASGKDKVGMPANTVDIGRLKGDADVVGAMQQADVLLFPSRSEGFGLVAAEAMACGLPVIATYGSSLVEVIEDGSSGYLCTQDDVAAFGDAVRKVASLGAGWGQLSRASRVRAVDKYDFTQMIDGYWRVYSSMCDGITIPDD